MVASSALKPVPGCLLSSRSEARDLPSRKRHTIPPRDGTVTRPVPTKSIRNVPPRLVNRKNDAASSSTPGSAPTRENPPYDSLSSASVPVMHRVRALLGARRNTDSACRPTAAIGAKHTLRRRENPRRGWERRFKRSPGVGAYLQRRNFKNHGLVPPIECGLYLHAAHLNLRCSSAEDCTHR
jgi:hypothetical protein